MGLEPVGSRPRQIVPDKGAKKPATEQKKEGVQPTSPTADVFVAGKHQAFRRWSQNVKSWQPTREGADELIRVEDVRFVAPAEPIKPMRSDADTPWLERRTGEFTIVEHAGLPPPRKWQRSWRRISISARRSLYSNGRSLVEGSPVFDLQPRIRDLMWGQSLVAT